MAAVWLPDPQKEVFAEDEVTISILAQTLQQGFFKVSLNNDGYLTVYTDGPRVIMTVNQDNKLIRFMSIYGVKESAPLELKHAFVNKMTDDVILVRFSIPESRPDLLIADYYLPFEDGIRAFQVVSALRLFSRIVPYAIRTCGENDLME
jgi:CheY-like chemotaxis protein